MASGSLMPAEGVYETGLEPYKTRQGKQEARIVAIHLPTKPHTLQPVSNGGIFIAYPDEGCDPLKKSLNSGS